MRTMFKMGLAYYENVSGIAKITTAGMVVCGLALLIVNLLK